MKSTIVRQKAWPELELEQREFVIQAPCGDNLDFLVQVPNKQPDPVKDEQFREVVERAEAGKIPGECHKCGAKWGEPERDPFTDTRSPEDAALTA